jgi:hypothetical protein
MQPVSKQTDNHSQGQIREEYLPKPNEGSATKPAEAPLKLDISHLLISFKPQQHQLLVLELMGLLG